MNKSNYINYNNAIGFGEATLATGGAAVPFTAIIDVTLAVLPFVVSWATGFTAHPAADARDFIKNLKPQIASADAHNRLAYVISGDSKINDRAKDVSASELVLWYKQNYPNDYKNLSNQDKVYFNEYLQKQAAKYKGVNQAARDYTNAMFNAGELSYNATPIQNVQNAASSAAQNLSSGSINWVLYGALAIGAIILLKKK